MKKKKQVDYELDVYDLVTDEEYNSIQDDRSIVEEVLTYIKKPENREETEDA